MPDESVESAVKRDLRRLPVEVRRSALAVAAVRLARQLDDEPTARDAAGLTRELRATLAALPEPPKPKADSVDDLRTRRAARRAAPGRRAAATDPVAP